MSNSTEASRHRVRTHSVAQRTLSGTVEEASNEERSSPSAHLLAMAVVVMLFGSLLGPLNSTAILAIAAGVVIVGILRSLARDGAIAWRTLGLALLIAGLVALRAYYDPPMSEYGDSKWVNFCTTTLATMAAAAAAFGKRAVRALALWWLVAGAALALLAVSGSDTGAGRAQVDGSNPVWLGRAIAASCVIAVWMGVSGVWRWWRVLLLLPLLGAGLLATGSRGPATAMVIGVLVLFLPPSERRSRQLIGVSVMGVVALLVAPLVPAVADSRFGQFLVEGDVEGEARSDMWLSGLRVIPDYPWGAGLGEWSTAATSSFDWPHNIFIEVFVEQGWLVGVLLVALVVTTIRRLWRQSGNDPAIQLALALVVTETVHVSTSGDLNARTFFFVLLLGVALLNKHRFQPPLEGQADEEELPQSAVPAR